MFKGGQKGGHQRAAHRHSTYSGALPSLTAELPNSSIWQKCSFGSIQRTWAFTVASRFYSPEGFLHAFLCSFLSNGIRLHGQGPLQMLNKNNNNISCFTSGTGLAHADGYLEALKCLVTCVCPLVLCQNSLGHFSRVSTALTVA